MNKCAKFHKDNPSDKKVKFNLPSAIELSETADFVYNFVQKPYASEQLRRRIWPTFPLNFLWNFHRRCLFTSSIPWCKKSKMTKNSNEGGPALILLCIQLGAVKLVLWRHGKHVTQVHPVTAEDQFHCTRLYKKPSTLVWHGHTAKLASSFPSSPLQDYKSPHPLEVDMAGAGEEVLLRLL